MSTADTDKPDSTASAEADQDDRPTVLSVIRALQSGTIGAKSISLSDRRACVEHLTGEGYTIVEVAEILKVSERTIARDRRAIQEAHAIERDPKLSEQMTGRLMREADLTISRMRRVAREKRTPPSVKVDAEHRCYQVLSDLVRTMQSLGYLPTAAHEIRADLIHRVDEPPGFDQMLAEVARLEVVLESSRGGDDGTRKQLTQLKTALTQFSANDQLVQISESLHEESDHEIQGP